MNAYIAIIAGKTGYASQNLTVLLRTVASAKNATVTVRNLREKYAVN
jgi:hypothetical protein